MASLEAESRVRNAVVMAIKDISLEGMVIWPDGAGFIHENFLFGDNNPSLRAPTTSSVDVGSSIPLFEGVVVFDGE